MPILKACYFVALGETEAACLLFVAKGCIANFFFGSEWCHSDGERTDYSTLFARGTLGNSSSTEDAEEAARAKGSQDERERRVKVFPASGANSVQF